MADYVFKMEAQSWSDDPYYVGSSSPVKNVEVIASTQQEAINEAARLLGSAGRGRHWRFFRIKARDIRLVTMDASDSKDPA